MAIPFYNQVDQDIYEGGEHYIPQQQYRLNYTPSTMLASTVGNTGGVTGTEAAVPYIWPPQGGGGGGNFGGPNNKFGLNLDTTKTIDMGRYVEKGGPANMYGGNYVKDSRKIAQDASGNWKDINTNQNVYHANLHNVKGIVGTVGDWLTGKSKNKDTRIGTWTGAEWDDEFDPTVANRDLNVYTRWKAKREFKAAQERQAAKDAKDAADAAAGGNGTDIGGGWTQTNTGGGGATFTGGGGQTHQGWSNTPEGYGAAAASEGSFAQGGRIGYRNGEFVDADVNIEGPGYDVNEQTAGFIDPQDALNDMSMDIFGKPLNLLNEDEYQILIDMANDQAMGEQDQGIASLV